MRCNHCSGTVVLTRTLDGPEYACIACSRPAGTASLGAPAPAPRERRMLYCPECGSRQMGEASLRGHMNAVHQGDPARFRAAGAEGITPTDRGWVL